MNRRRQTRAIPLALATCLLCPALSPAKKPDNPGGGKGGGGQPPVYQLIDLLGFDNDGLGLQSTAQFITNHDGDGGVLIYGDSYLRFSGAPAKKYPALWQIAGDGTFPASDPVNLGLPSFAGEVEPTGFNQLGVGVGWTRMAVEKDENGNWVFPGYVDVPGLPYQELPEPVKRDADPNGINDSGVIVGQYAVEDASTQSGFRTVGGLWRLNPDGTINDPVNLGEFIPWAINNSGVMAGMHQGYPAIAWFDGPTLMMNQLVGSQRYFAADIHSLNDYPIGDERLTVVGRSWLNEAGIYNEPDSRRALVWRPFDTADSVDVLGTLGGWSSTARDVNSAGDIVGWSDTKRRGHQAFIYSNGVMTNLNSLADVGSNTLQWAYAINDSSDIVGFMKIPRPISEQRGFLLRPIPAE